MNDNPDQRGQPAGSWALCVATYNRIDTLLLCVRLALVQTRPPMEIVIVDASDGWEENGRRVAALVAQVPSIRLVYLQAHRRSLTAQRNQGVAAASADVLFMIDDDSLMRADCAARIMAVYDRDQIRSIAAVGAVHDDALPEADLKRPLGAVAAEMHKLPDTKVSGINAHRNRFNAAFRSSRIFRFLWREVLLMAAERRFVRYDGPKRHQPESPFHAADFPDAVRVDFISGYAITVRRCVVVQEPFDDGLVAYAAAEDLDATYRFSRHGVNVLAPQARLHHMEAASGRIKRTKAAAFGLLNIAYFVRKNSPRPVSDGLLVVVLALRMLPAELVKDLASRRWSLPQVRGVLLACAHLPRVLTPAPIAIATVVRRSARRDPAKHDLNAAKPDAPARPR